MTTDTIETALAVQQEQELEALLENVDLGVAGEENLESGDIGMPPRLRISAQNRPIQVGDKIAPPGSIVNTLTGEVYEHGLDIVPLVFLPRTRVMWPTEFNANNEPQCASDDGHIPSASSDTRTLINPQVGPCADCPFGKFGANGEAPACKMQRNFLVMLVEQGEPAILTMQSTALTPARTLTTLAKTQGVRKSIKFVTQLQNGDQGTWYVPAFTKGRKLTNAEILALVEARDELKNLVIAADVTVQENGTGGSGGNGGSGGSSDAVPYEEDEIIPF
jgi:hypothetical protein